MSTPSTTNVVSPSIILHHGDCFEVLRGLPDASIDLLVTDPPYGTTLLPFDRAARKNKIDWKLWWEEVHRVCKPTAVLVVFAAQPFTTDMVSNNRRNFRYSMVWAKPYSVGHLSANVRPLRAHEDILVFCRRFGPKRVRQGEHLVRQMQSTYNPQFTEGTPYTHHYRAAPARHYSAQRELPSVHNLGRRYPISVLTFGRDKPCHHPTAKPAKLCEWLVKSFSHAGDTVLDPFMGAGSTGVACAATGRNFVGVELDAAYYEIARTRLTQEQTIAQHEATPCEHEATP